MVLGPFHGGGGTPVSGPFHGGVEGIKSVVPGPFQGEGTTVSGPLKGGGGGGQVGPQTRPEYPSS